MMEEANRLIPEKCVPHYRSQCMMKVRPCTCCGSGRSDYRVCARGALISQTDMGCGPGGLHGLWATGNDTL